MSDVVDDTFEDEPDPALVWRWAGRASAPLVGWVLAILGVIAIILGWVGASRETFPAQQIPYLISGGLLGVALIFFGGIFLGIQDVRRMGERLKRVERQVDELHSVLLQRTDAHREPPALHAGGDSTDTVKMSTHASA